MNDQEMVKKVEEELVAKQGEATSQTKAAPGGIPNQSDPGSQKLKGPQMRITLPPEDAWKLEAFRTRVERSQAGVYATQISLANAQTELRMTAEALERLEKELSEKHGAPLTNYDIDPEKGLAQLRGPQRR